ncbi:hypothetical protein FI667_g767, partial [Globisporangium splendens]
MRATRILSKQRPRESPQQPHKRETTHRLTGRAGFCISGRWSATDEQHATLLRSSVVALRCGRSSTRVLPLLSATAQVTTSPALMCAPILPLLWIAAAVAHVNAEVLTPVNNSTKNATAHANAEAMVDLQHFGVIAERVAPIAGLLFGPALCFFGYTWYTHIVLVAGFIFGGVLFSIAAYLIAESYSLWASLFMTAAFFVGGLLVAAIVKQRQAIGTFAIGGGLGIGIAYIAFCFADLPLGSGGVKPLLAGSASVLTLLIGALFVKYEKATITGFTSVCGAYCWCYGVGHFVGHFPTWRALYDCAWPKAHDDSGPDYPVVWWWVYLSGFMVLVVWSLRVQCAREDREGGDSTKLHTQQQMLVSSPTDVEARHAGYQRV